MGVEACTVLSEGEVVVSLEWEVKYCIVLSGGELVSVRTGSQGMYYLVRR